MSAALKTRRAGLLAALASVVALSCGSDTIDLLPATGPSGGGAAAGTSGGDVAAAGTDVSSAGKAGMSGAGPTVAGGSSSGGGGNSSIGGQSGRGGGCFGPGCGGGGLGMGGFGFPCELNGVNTCQPCKSDDQCPSNQHCAHNVCAECWGDGDCTNGVCDPLSHRCAPGCQKSIECRGGRVCDTNYNVCVTCTLAEGCPPSMGGDMDARTCYNRRCVECITDEYCGGDRKHCVGYHCVCLNNAECGDNMFCDLGSGRCQQR